MASDDGVTFTHVSFTPSASRRPAQKPILNDISLELDAGTTTALLGRSGSGKTTLLRTINGLVLPTQGTVRVLGTQVSATTSQDVLRELRHSIGYVIQETGLFPHMSVGRNVAMPMELAGAKPQDRRARVDDLLSTVGLQAQQFSDRLPHELSGGQRQRVGLARALAAQPKLLLLDEPFGALDPLTRFEMQSVLRDLIRKFRTTAVMVTHDLQEAIFLADRVLFLDSGSIYADLAAHDVLQSTHTGVREYVRAATRYEETAA